MVKISVQADIPRQKWKSRGCIQI